MGKQGGTKVVAVDVGSGFTQFTDGKIEGSFPSLVCPCPDNLGYGAEGAEIITFGSNQFLFGEDAKAYGDPSKRTDTLNNDWAGSEPWKVLMFAALARMGVNGGEPVRVVTGLPQSLFAAKEDTVRSTLKGEASFSYMGSSFAMDIDPHLIPQATGALFYQASKDDSLLTKPVGVIDIGTYTTGFSVIDETRYVHQRTGGCTVGISQLLSLLQEYLAKDGYKIAEAKLPNILKERQFLFRGQMTEIDERTLTQLVLRVADPMLQELNKKWDGGDDLLVFVAGGGAEAFLPAIKTIVPHAQVMSEAFFAVVKGMYVAGSQAPAK